MKQLLNKMFYQPNKLKAALATLLLIALCACSMAEVGKSTSEQGAEKGAEKGVEQGHEQTRERVNIDFDWLFYLGDESLAKNTDFDDQNWRELDLPHDWRI